jgi:hypothetical protein
MEQHKKHIHTRGLYFATFFLGLLTFLFIPEVTLADVDSSLRGIQGKLTNIIMPTVSMIAVGWAAISLMTGNERAKTHIMYAIIACAVGFGAKSIVEFIQATVR